MRGDDAVRVAGTGRDENTDKERPAARAKRGVEESRRQERRRLHPEGDT